MANYFIFHWFLLISKKWNCFGTFNANLFCISQNQSIFWRVNNYSCIVLTWHSIIPTLITHNTCTIFLLHWYMLCHGACVFLHIHVYTCTFTWIISVLFFMPYFMYDTISVFFEDASIFYHVLQALLQHTSLIYTHLSISWCCIQGNIHPIFFHPFSPSCQ